MPAGDATAPRARGPSPAPSARARPVPPVGSWAQPDRSTHRDLSATTWPGPTRRTSHAVRAGRSLVGVRGHLVYNTPSETAKNPPARVRLPMDLKHASSLDFPDPTSGEWVDPIEERSRMRRTLRR